MQKKILHIVSEGKTTAYENVYADLTFQPDEMIIRHVTSHCTDWDADALKVMSATCVTLNSSGPLVYYLAAHSTQFDLRFPVTGPIPTTLRFLFDRTSVTDNIKTVITVEFVKHGKYN
jgi:hypothetical protein